MISLVTYACPFDDESGRVLPKDRDSSGRFRRRPTGSVPFLAALKYCESVVMFPSWPSSLNGVEVGQRDSRYPEVVAPLLAGLADHLVVLDSPGSVPV
jgi:hypothetical protein